MNKFEEIMPSGVILLDGFGCTFKIIYIYDIVFVWNDLKKWWQLWRIFNDMTNSNISSFSEVRDGLEQLKAWGKFIIIEGSVYHIHWNKRESYCILQSLTVDNI